MTHHNPLFPATDDPDQPAGQSNHFALPNNRNHVIKPLSTADEIREAQAAASKETTNSRNQAANLIRQKLDAIFAEEPAANEELEEISHHHDNTLSRHQEYLKNVQRHATSVAQIQQQWHEYYSQLPEEEKHQIWREFYDEQSKHSRYAHFSAQKKEPEKPIVKPQPASVITPVATVLDPDEPVIHKPEKMETHTFLDKPKREPKEEKTKPVVSSHHEIATPSAAHKRVEDKRARKEKRTPRQMKIDLRKHVSEQAHKQARKSGWHSVIFGLSMGLVAMVIMMFGLFNERIIAPLIQPSRNVSTTPIILNNDSVIADEVPKIIVPKINIEIPVNYSVASLAEADVQKGLEDGVIHYPVTSDPGEKGNAAYFGHSSNNIFNPGKYKFAFVLLVRLEKGDMFYLTKNGKVYAYEVFKKQVVSPQETWVLGAVKGHTATAALITCDPPGTTLKRLVVWGEQVTPDPKDAAPSSVEDASFANQSPLPGNPKSIWERFTSWLF